MANKTTDDLSRLLRDYANSLADHDDYPRAAELFRNAADRIESMAGLLRKYGELRGSLFKKDALSKTIDELEAEVTALRGALAMSHKECEKCGALVAVWTEEELAEAKIEGKKLADSLKWE